MGAAYPYFAKRLMEDPDPQLRKSLKEMVFEGSIFNWVRLEELINSAGSQQKINLDPLITQTIDFIFSNQGKIIRDQLKKITVAIQGDRLRVSGKSKDELQRAIEILKEEEDKLEIPLQFENYR